MDSTPMAAISSLTTARVRERGGCPGSCWGAAEFLGVAPGARLLAGHREPILANAPFRADNRVRLRARLRAVLDAEYGRVRMWRDKRRINGRPSDARGLPRIIAALDEHGTCR